MPDPINVPVPCTCPQVHEDGDQDDARVFPRIDQRYLIPTEEFTVAFIFLD